MKLSEKLKEYHESGDFGSALGDVWREAEKLEQKLTTTQQELERANQKLVDTQTRLEEAEEILAMFCAEYEETENFDEIYERADFLIENQQR